MDVTLQQHDAKLVFPVPWGLRELCADMTREVLRSQPANAYAFLADYCDALLRTRDAALLAASVVDDILRTQETYEDRLLARGITLEQANRAATTIQAAWRGFVTRRKIWEEMRPVELIMARNRVARSVADAMATMIQKAFRGFRTRQMIKESIKPKPIRCGVVATRIAKEYCLTLEEAHRAATIIQKAFRGHISRTKKLPRFTSILESKAEDLDVIKWAASLIQRSYRAHLSKRSFNIGIIMNILLQTNNTWQRANEAAIMIQKMFRGWLVRSKVPYDLMKKTSEAGFTEGQGSKRLSEGSARAQIAPSNEEVYEVEEITPIIPVSLSPSLLSEEMDETEFEPEDSQKESERETERESEVESDISSTDVEDVEEMEKTEPVEERAEEELHEAEFDGGETTEAEEDVLDIDNQID